MKTAPDFAPPDSDDMSDDEIFEAIERIKYTFLSLADLMGSLLHDSSLVAAGMMAATGEMLLSDPEATVEEVQSTMTHFCDSLPELAKIMAMRQSEGSC